MSLLLPSPGAGGRGRSARRTNGPRTPEDKIGKERVYRIVVKNAVRKGRSSRKAA
jgi:hypothetical protein